MPLLQASLQLLLLQLPLYLRPEWGLEPGSSDPALLHRYHEPWRPFLFISLAWKP